MPTKKETDRYLMNSSLGVSELSKGVRSKVGAILVTENGVTISGTNGLPSQLGNVLEYSDSEGNTITKPQVIHAEENALLKCCREGVRTKGATIYVTLSPCEHCASMLITAGIKEVVYKEKYRKTQGLTDLMTGGVIVREYKE